MAKDLIGAFLPVAESVPSRSLTMEIGTTFGPFYINLFASRPTFIGFYTANPLTNVFTLANHGLVNGTMVQVVPSTATANLTDGLEGGELYFIVNKSTNTYQLSKICGGGAPSSSFSAIVEIDDATPGGLYVCGEPYNLTNHKVWSWVKHFRTDPDNMLIMDLQPSITGAALCVNYDWQITFSKTVAQTFNLSAGTHVWDLILQFPDGTRKILIQDAFQIAQPATHPIS